MNISDKQLLKLKKLLSETPLANLDELEQIRLHAPGVFHSEKAYDENAFFVTRYSLHYKPINDFLAKLTNWDAKHMTTLHHIHYIEGSKAREHVDASDLTCVIMMDNQSEGGEFLFNKKPMRFQDPGEYMIYKGSSLHEVKPLTSGIRDVLVVWYRKNVDNTISNKSII